MISSGLVQLQNEYNLTPHNGGLYGFIQGFPVLMCGDKRNQYLWINVGVGHADEINVLKLLSHPLATYRIKDYTQHYDMLIIHFHDKSAGLTFIHNYIQTEMPALYEGGFLGGQTVCNNCGEAIGDEPSAFLVVGTQPEMVHERCVDDITAMVEKVNAQATVKLNERSSKWAPLGAVLFALLGVIPCVALYAFDIHLPFLAALIPLGANYGHQKFGGKPGKVRYALMIVLSLLLVPIAHYAGTIAGMVGSTYSINSGLTASDLPNIIAQANMLERAFLRMGVITDDFIFGLCVVYFFTLLALILTIRKTIRTSRIDIYKVERIDVHH
ncbi:hypothetical protein LJC33_04320 [Eubacteriales bacterium OttesenSCG-928-N13]|nr:hypothetical protein [Eubacteriales bacterium OttesenSCG-928-N13]